MILFFRVKIFSTLKPCKNKRRLQDQSLPPRREKNKKSPKHDLPRTQRSHTNKKKKSRNAPLPGRRSSGESKAATTAAAAAACCYSGGGETATSMPPSRFFFSFFLGERELIQSTPRSSRRIVVPTQEEEEKEEGIQELEGRRRGETNRVGGREWLDLPLPNRGIKAKPPMEEEEEAKKSRRLWQLGR